MKGRIGMSSDFDAIEREIEELFYREPSRNRCSFVLSRRRPINGGSPSSPLTHTSKITGMISGRLDVCFDKYRFKSARIFS